MQSVEMRTLELPSGETIPVLGQGTWHFAERADRRQQEIEALRLGLDLGMTLVDTSEMYADGAAEELVGEAIAGRRDQVSCQQGATGELVAARNDSSVRAQSATATNRLA